MDKHRENGTYSNLGVRHGETLLFRYTMSEHPLPKYRSRTPQNPDLAGDWVTQGEQEEAPLPGYVWLGNAENTEGGREIKAPGKTERGAQCARWDSTVALDLHHRTARRYGGKDTLDNAEWLCRPCPVQTPTFGDHSRWH